MKKRTSDLELRSRDRWSYAHFGQALYLLQEKVE